LKTSQLQLHVVLSAAKLHKKLCKNWHICCFPPGAWIQKSDQWSENPSWVSCLCGNPSWMSCL